MAYPGLSLRLSEDKTARLLGPLRASDLDVILLTMPMTEDGFIAAPLFFEPFSLVCPTGHRLADGPIASGLDLDGDDLLLPALSLAGRGHLSALVTIRALPELKLGRTIGLVWRASDPRREEFQRLAAWLGDRVPEGVPEGVLKTAGKIP